MPLRVCLGNYFLKQKKFPAKEHKGHKEEHKKINLTEVLRGRNAPVSKRVRVELVILLSYSSTAEIIPNKG
jgi:hypothetical protein